MMIGQRAASSSDARAFGQWWPHSSACRQRLHRRTIGGDDRDSQCALLAGGVTQGWAWTAAADWVQDELVVLPVRAGHWGRLIP
jgi:hypothetical protein